MLIGRVKLMVYLGLLFLAVSSCASASVIWTLNNVQFNGNGGTNTATGSFEVDSGLASLVTWNITVTGTNVAADAVYQPVGGGSSFNPNEAQFFFNPFTSQFLILDFSTPLSNAGGTVALSASSLACPGCGTLISGTVSSSPTDGGEVPEPSSSALYLTGAGIVGIALFCRKRIRTS